MKLKDKILNERTRFTVQDDVFKRIKELGFKVDGIITYKDVCNILQVEPSNATNTRAKHWRDVSQFMKLEDYKRGKKLITEIYESVQEREDNRGNNKTYDDKEIRDLMKYYYLVRASEILDIPIDNLIDDELHENFTIYNDYWNTFVGVGLCTKDAKNVQAEDLMNHEKFREYDLDVIYYMTNNFFMERQRVLRYKSLKDFVKLERIIVFNDKESRITDEFEDEEIQQALNKALDNYNNEWNTTHKTLSTIPTNKQRNKVINDKKRNVEIHDYKGDYKGIVMECHIKSVIEELELQDLTHEQIICRYVLLRQKLNRECYSHYAQKIYEHFDNEEQIEQALDILDYLVKL